MDSQTLTVIWLCAGILLLLSELVIPGAVMGFLGAGAIVVAGLRFVGVIDGVMASFLAWFAISLGLLITLRRFVSRFSSAERSVQSSDEDADTFGQVATVVNDIVAGEASGRIRFRGTTWPARCLSGTLPEGSEVKILDRDNVSFIVEPLLKLPDARRDSTH